MQVTRWHEKVCDEDRMCPAGEVEVRDLARAMAGALFVSLPLLFTMEMWEIAKTIPAGVLLALLAASFTFNRLFLEYAGYRKEAWQRSKMWDTVVTMGVGAVASSITLFAAGIINLQLDWMLSIKTIALEMVPTSMGAAVAANQLGAGDSRKDNEIHGSKDLNVILGSLLGGFLFAFNIAPTMETKVVVLKQSWGLIGLTFALSLAVSYLMVAVAQFEQRDLSKRKIITSEWLEALIAYLIAFLVSMMLLWVFGYGTPMDPLQVWLPQTIALAYATTLGGAAGRLVL